MNSRSWPRRPDRFRLWRRAMLRMLGIPFGMQNALLDERRWTITVSSHAISQAGERYRQGDPKHIIAEVAAAMCEGRTGGKATNHRAWNLAQLAWTPDHQKTYVIKRVKRGWLVVTALPPTNAEATA